MPAYTLTVNGERRQFEAAADTPLLWVLRDILNLTGTKYGCGAGLCRACTIHLDGEASFSCQIPISAADGRRVTTIEGLSPDRSHPLQTGVDRGRRAAVRLLPAGTDHERGCAAREDARAERRARSTTGCRRTCVAAGPTTGSGARSSAPPRSESSMAEPRRSSSDGSLSRRALLQVSGGVGLGLVVSFLARGRCRARARGAAARSRRRGQRLRPHRARRNRHLLAAEIRDGPRAS